MSNSQRYTFTVFIRLYENQLTGPIPPELFNSSVSKFWFQSVMIIIYIHYACDNALLTSQYGLDDLTCLLSTSQSYSYTYTFPVRVQLDDNQFTGTIPPELGNWSNLGKF